MTDTGRNEPEKLLDVEEVASLLGIHPQTTYDMARSGEIRAFKVGREWRFRPSDVKAWQDEKAGAAVAPAEEVA